MAFIPAPLRAMCDGQGSLEVEGNNVREVIAALERRFPGVAARLCEGDQLARGLAVTVDGVMSSRGLATKVNAQSEVHFLPALGGG